MLPTDSSMQLEEQACYYESYPQNAVTLHSWKTKFYILLSFTFVFPVKSSFEVLNKVISVSYFPMNAAQLPFSAFHLYFIDRKQI
jgi:hypothetical protein